MDNLLASKWRRHLGHGRVEVFNAAALYASKLTSWFEAPVKWLRLDGSDGKNCGLIGSG